MGCGPGQITAYLYNSGATNIIGIDLSEKMVEQAKKYHPQIKFETGDMLKLDKPDNSFGALTAFYSIVHFDSAQVKIFFAEAYRTLKPSGQLLVSFHVGDGIMSVNEFFGIEASADFHFHLTDAVCKLLTETGFELIDVMIRNPYIGKEHASKRAYIIVEKN